MAGAGLCSLGCCCLVRGADCGSDTQVNAVTSGSATRSHIECRATAIAVFALLVRVKPLFLRFQNRLVLTFETLVLGKVTLNSLRKGPLPCSFLFFFIFILFFLFFFPACSLRFGPHCALQARQCLCGRSCGAAAALGSFKNGICPILLL